jgi:hypothetical protein
MPARSAQTHAKRARELAVKERRERKREKKAAAAALRAGNADSSASGAEAPESAAQEPGGSEVGDESRAQ